MVTWKGDGHHRHPATAPPSPSICRDKCCSGNVALRVIPHQSPIINHQSSITFVIPCWRLSGRYMTTRPVDEGVDCTRKAQGRCPSPPPPSPPPSPSARRDRRDQCTTRSSGSVHDAIVGILPSPGTFHVQRTVPFVSPFFMHPSPDLIQYFSTSACVDAA